MKRQVAAATAAVVLALSACGGSSGPSALSEDDFLNTLADVCSGAQKDLERVDPPTDAADTERFADDVSEIYVDVQTELKTIVPPDDYSRDFGKLTDVIDTAIDTLGDLAKAGKNEDPGKIESLIADLVDLSEDQVGIADDLGVDECAPDGTATPSPATTIAATLPPATVPETTVAPAPLTLPPTLPPATAPPVATDPPTTGQLFSVMDLATVYFAPEGFSFVSKTPDQATLDAVSASDLNILMDRFGVATLVNDSGTEVADVWIGVALLDNPGMPASWKDLDCGLDGVLRQSEGGILGIVCPAAAASPFYEIFTATSGGIGISVYTRLPNIGGDLVADAVLEANL